MSPTETVKTAQLYAADFRADFPEWLRANHPIYAEFERQAMNIAARRDRYSARTILEVMRHNSALSENGGHFKLNNNRAPCMARLFSIMHPEHAGFFQLRDSDMRMGLAA